MPDSNWRMGLTYSWLAGSIGLGTIRIGGIVFSIILWSLLESVFEGRRSRGYGREWEIPTKWGWDEVWGLGGVSKGIKCAEHEYVGLSFGFVL